MEKISKQWHEKIRVGHLTRHDAWTALNSTLMKKLEYPLPALTLEKKDCNNIISSILSGGLPRIGVCKKMARALVYLPTKFQGLGVHDLYISQGLSHIKVLLDSIWQRTTTGRLLTTTIEYLKIEVGLRGSILLHCCDTFGHLAENS